VNETIGITKDCSKVAEAALRNLYVDGQTVEEPARRFESRLRRLAREGLLIDPPHYHGEPIELTAGEMVTCSCQLGREILRFTAIVREPAYTGTDSGREFPAALLSCPDEPTVVQRRRYFRLPLSGRQDTEATFWAVEADPKGPTRVCGEFHGTILDVSAGGVGVALRDAEPIQQLGHRQLWVRFTLPGENESLIFRVELKHVQAPDAHGACQIGLELVEFIEPGQYQAIFRKLTQFVATQ